MPIVAIGDGWGTIGWVTITAVLISHPFFLVKLRFNFTCVFKGSQIALVAICETLKTRAKLNLYFTRPHAITYTNLTKI